MNDVTATFAKLAGILRAAQLLLDARARQGLTQPRPYLNFSAEDVSSYFEGARKQLEMLQVRLPELFGDFPPIKTEPTTKMAEGHPPRYGRDQLDSLVRTITQMFEIRANSELATPEAAALKPRVFISHGRAQDWREVQAYIDHDLGIATLELAQEANLGRTVLQKLAEEASKCTSAVIVMTGDDTDADGNARARENVLHEIGYCQSKYGLSAVCLLHEEGTNIPSNIHGLVYIPFPKGTVSATFGALARELKAFYRL